MNITIRVLSVVFWFITNTYVDSPYKFAHKDRVRDSHCVEWGAGVLIWGIKQTTNWKSSDSTSLELAIYNIHMFYLLSSELQMLTLKGLYHEIDFDNVDEN